MSAIKLEGDELAAHAENCATATTAVHELRVHERGLTAREARGKRTPITELRELLDGVLHKLRPLAPAGNCWLRADVIKIVGEICDGTIEIEWNGHPVSKESAKPAILEIRHTEDGHALSVRMRATNLHFLTPEVMLGFLLQIATIIAFERAIMRAYGLSQLEVQTLVLRNGRAREHVEALLDALVAFNVNGWWDEHEDGLRRFGHPLKQGSSPATRFTLREPSCDLPLYAAAGVHAGEKIDLFAAVGQCPSNEGFRAAVRTLGEHNSIDALRPLYDMSLSLNPVLLPAPLTAMTAAPEAAAPSPPP